MTPEEQEEDVANAAQEEAEQPFGGRDPGFVLLTHGTGRTTRVLGEDEARAGLAKKVVAIMAAVERVPKRGRNTMQNYDYATEGDILDAIRAQCVAQGVAILPSVTSAELAYKVVGRNGDIPVTRVWVEFLFIDAETGATLVRRFPGDGMDSGDKGIYKAITGAEKYAVSKSFMVSTGDDPEKDAKDDQRTQSGGGRTAAGRNARAGASRTEGAPPASPPPSSKPIGDDAASDLEMLANDAGVAVSAILDKYKVAKLTELTLAQGMEATAKLSKRIHDAKQAAAKGAA